MTDYQKMYAYLFNAVTDALKILQTSQQENIAADAMRVLQTAQQNTEKIYMSAEE